MNIKCCIFTASSNYNRQCKNNATDWIVVEHNPDVVGPVCKTHVNLAPEQMHTINWDHVRPLNDTAVVDNRDETTHINIHSKEETVQNKLDYDEACDCACHGNMPHPHPINVDGEIVMCCDCPLTAGQAASVRIEKRKMMQELIDQAEANSRVMGIINEGEPGVYEPDPEEVDAYSSHGEDFIVAGTGSRSLQNSPTEVKTEVFNEIIEILTKFKEQYGDRLVVMSGMAEGFDKALATAAIKLEIRLHCAIPNKTYGAYYWGQMSLTGKDQLPAFNAMLDNAEKVTYIMEDVMKKRGIFVWRDGKKYHSNFLRNDWMVSRANHFLVFDPSSRGTGQCFASIKRAKLPYTLIPTKEV